MAERINQSRLNRSIGSPLMNVRREPLRIARISACDTIIAYISNYLVAWFAPLVADIGQIACPGESTLVKPMQTLVW